MKPAHIIGTLVIVAFAVFGGSAFKKSLTPYVGFEEARQSERTVQVRGQRVPGTARFDEAAQSFLFDVTDESKDRMQVVYQGVKPGNFDQATELVLIGRYREGAFHSDRMLVKCPSKYQGAEEAGKEPPR